MKNCGLRLFSYGAKEVLLRLIRAKDVVLLPMSSTSGVKLTHRRTITDCRSTLVMNLNYAWLEVDLRSSCALVHLVYLLLRGLNRLTCAPLATMIT